MTVHAFVVSTAVDHSTPFALIARVVVFVMATAAALLDRKSIRN